MLDGFFSRVTSLHGHELNQPTRRLLCLIARNAEKKPTFCMKGTARNAETKCRTNWMNTMQGMQNAMNEYNARFDFWERCTYAEKDFCIRSAVGI